MMVLRDKRKHTRPFVCWGFSWELWSGGAPKLAVGDYLITGPMLILTTHIHKNETEGSHTAQTGKVSPTKLCLGPLPYLGRNIEALACLQIKHSVSGPPD